jgi:hypothetical protein
MDRAIERTIAMATSRLPGSIALLSVGIAWLAMAVASTCRSLRNLHNLLDLQTHRFIISPSRLLAD